jgi:GNAT superfamily N-acetyltransferase
VIVGRAGIVERFIRIGEELMHVGGVSAVATHPDWWRRGVATMALRRASAFVCEELGAHAGLLLATRMAAPLYERIGWRRMNGPLICEQPEEQLRWTEAFPDKPVMGLPCGGREPPDGPIDLCGLPW